MGFNLNLSSRDLKLIFLTRILRMFSYGMLAVVFFDNLFFKNVQPPYASWIQSAIILGDIVVSLLLTTLADKIGRRNTLMFASLLKLITGVIYAQSDDLTVLAISGIVGIVSVTGGEIGPFMSIEQSILSQLVEHYTIDGQHIPKTISTAFGFYNMVGYLSQAAGAACAGLFLEIAMTKYGFCRAVAIKYVLYSYATLGGFLLVAYFMMNRKKVQAPITKEKPAISCSGIKMQNIENIISLSFLFCLDAFAGAFVVQSYLSYYYQTKYDLDFDEIGYILFICNFLGAISGVFSSKIVDKIGAMATMICTHLPSNILLTAIAFTSNSTISIQLLFARFCISHMSSPARQTYVAMMVSNQERTAANGITNIARSFGLILGVGLTGFFMNKVAESPMFSYPFLIAGGLKILYDILMCWLFLYKQDTNKKQQKFSVQSTEMLENHTMEQQQDSKEEGKQ